MLVIGGRSAWLWARSGVVTGGLGAVLATASCGGRTSTLDPDVYGTGTNPQGEGGGGSTARGGSSGGGRGGAASGTVGGGVNPSGGSTSSGGKPTNPDAVDPDLAIGPCTNYCPGYGTQCKELLGNQDCMSACQAEMNGFGKSCQSLGIKTLQCLTPFFKPGGMNCSQAVQKALAKCGNLVNQFDACKEKASNPAPAKNPTITLDPTSCSSSGQGDPTFCNTTYQCASGPYAVTCKTDPSSQQHSCSCSTPTGVYSLPVDAGALDGDPCAAAAPLCFAFAAQQ